LIDDALLARVDLGFSKLLPATAAVEVANVLALTIASQ
jgi:hypothetical protein